MRFLHTMIRVNDLDESIHFYTEVMGMKLLAKNDYPEGQFTLAFVGFGSNKREPCIELTYNYDKSEYQLGNAFGHIAFGVEDIYKICDTIRKRGGKIVREPGPMKNSTTVLAFVEDPNGYKIELIQTNND